MKCPVCGCGDADAILVTEEFKRARPRVVFSIKALDGCRRVRMCRVCGYAFSTTERVDSERGEDGTE